MGRSRSTLQLLLPLLAVSLGVSLADEPSKPNVGRSPRIEDFAPPEEFVVAGGVKTHFVAKGMKGLPVVFIHGFGSCTYTWRLNLDQIAKTQRVYAIDVKGFGLSEKPRDGKYDIDVYTEHLLAFLDTMKLDRAVLVGNSMGGAIAVRLALRRPDRVAGLILVDPAPPDFRVRVGDRNPADVPKPTVKEPGPFDVLKARVLEGLARTDLGRKGIEAGLKAAYHDPRMVTPELVEIMYRPLTIEGAAEAMLAMTSSAAYPPAKIPPLTSLKAPTLIVWGRHDKVIPVALGKRFVESIPKSKLVIFEHSGHMPHEEESDWFNTLAAAFISEVDRGEKQAR